MSMRDDCRASTRLCDHSSSAIWIDGMRRRGDEARPKEIVIRNCGRNTQASISPKHRADYRFATPLLATPGEALGERVNLIVVAAGKSE
jgi:hypothetical protein